MEVKKSQSNSNLLARIKIVKGENFVTIEDTKSLADQELIELITYLMGQSFIKNCKNVNILVNSKFNKEVDFLLIENGFKLHDENVTVHKVLDDSSKVKNGFLLKDLHELSLAEFKRVWEESMKGSLNAPSSLNVDEQMRSVELELGPNYKKSCIIAYDKGNPIGVIMPHIEPGTQKKEGFFILESFQAKEGRE